jgi:hypothetical protein
MTHDETRKRHSEQLHGYRHSAEYAEYAKEAGAEPPQGPLPSLLGKRWEIDKETYGEFLEVLPPLARRGGSFYLSEFVFGDITTKYTKEGDRYYCEFARYPVRKQEPTQWAIYIGSRELAREMNDPLLGIVEADTKEQAEDIAAKSGEIAGKAVAGGGLWAVRMKEPDQRRGKGA